MTRSITIVGGSIAGLTLAATLDPAQFDVTVYEAAPARAQYGSALSLWPAAVRVLQRIGAWQRLDGDIEQPHGGAFYDIQGRLVLPVGGPPLRLVERPLVVAAIDAAVPAAVRRVTQQIDEPASLPGDLVIGADGVRSVVRPLVTARPDRVETPYVALRGVVDASSLAAGEVPYGEYWGEGLLFGLAPMTQGRAYFFTSHRSGLGPEPLAASAVAEEARAAFEEAGCAPLIRAALDQVGPRTGATRLWVTPPMARYARGRHVVVGDAAHAMLPNLGRGACDAILDGWTLGQTLNAGRPVAAWEARRVPVTQAARVTAGGIMRAAVGRRTNAARDALLRR